MRGLCDGLSSLLLPLTWYAEMKPGIFEACKELNTNNFVGTACGFYFHGRFLPLLAFKLRIKISGIGHFVNIKNLALAIPVHEV